MTRAWSEESRKMIAEAAANSGFSESAGLAMAEALAASGGAMAQFHHPELGGMGQWSSGGMMMIGDMFNDALKSRVRSLAEALASELRRDGLSFEGAAATASGGSGSFGQWWPSELGSPTSTGAQNGRRYAVFPAASRLALEIDGAVSVYDTGAHRIGGASQQQGSADTLAFSSGGGRVELRDFVEITDGHTNKARETEPQESREAELGREEPAMLEPSSAPAAVTGAERGDPLALLQRLAELKSLGIVTDEEFAAKKADLLSRI